MLMAAPQSYYFLEKKTTPLSRFRFVVLKLHCMNCSEEHSRKNITVGLKLLLVPGTRKFKFHNKVINKCDWINVTGK